MTQARRLLDGIASGLEETSRVASARIHSESQLLTRMLEIAQVLNSIHDRDELLTSVSRSLRELFDAENSFVVLLDENGDPDPEALWMDARSRAGMTLDGSLPLSETILRRAVEARAPISIDDTADQPELSGRGSIERLHIRSVLCAPLIVVGKVIGVLQFDHRSALARFPERDRGLLQLFADQVATALHNLLLIEDLKSANEQIRQSHEEMTRATQLKAIGQAAASLAHNFNNSLCTALGNCDVLLQRGDLPLEVKESIQMIRSRTLAAGETVRRLTAVGRSGVGPKHSSYCRLSDLVAELVPEFQQRLRMAALEKGVELELVPRLEPTPLVAGEASELSEVVTNLVFNAIDAMDRSGAVEIETGVESGRVLVRVRDQGHGIPPEVKERVFDSFFTTKAAHGGSGLGLPISLDTALRLGGEIKVDSREGAGSSFVLWLPVAETVNRSDLLVAEVRRAESEVPPPAPSGGVTGLRVLLIDDDPSVLTTMGRMLRLLGHACEEIDDPARALRRLRHGAVDAVFTDLGNVPGSAVDAAYGLRIARASNAQAPEVPVFVVTGSSGRPVSVAESSVGVTEVLSKPISLHDLAAAIARAFPSA